MRKKPNIILITIDALRADHLKGKNFKKLMEDSTVFENAYSVGPMTSHSFISILTSTYPLDYNGPEEIKPPRHLISEVLQKAGYTTAAFHSNPYLTDFFGYNKGWDYFEDTIAKEDTFLATGKKKIKRLIMIKILKILTKSLFNISPAFTFKLRYWLYKKDLLRTTPKGSANAEYLNKSAKEFITNAENPFFCFIHYLDIHTPYVPYDYHHKPRKLTEQEMTYKELPGFLADEFTSKKKFMDFAKKHIQGSIDFYDAGVKYVDEQIGQLMDCLKENNLYKDTLIVLTADHGDEFLEHNEGGHSKKLYNELLKVPLLIKQ